MKVKEIMTGEARSCRPDTSLAAAAMFMWEEDCGVLPVVGDGERVVGMITDRDICMAVAMRPSPASEIPVSEIISHRVFSCSPEAEVHDALKLMQEERVHRLAVVDGDGTLRGLLSLNDIVLEAKQAKGRKTTAVTYTDVVDTFKAICAHRSLPQVQSEPPEGQAATA
ncbi:MAG TPA: CBS domain-containing protein [Pyrinomonadaceae bacterium]|nr:CBS domain-containing protein [Pyrinomonadaceae bacterium]